MLYFSRWKAFSIIAVSLLGILFALPNLFSPSQLESLPSWMQKRMPLGLDLQGGSHLLLQMNVDELRQDWLESISGDVRQTLRQERIGYSGLTARGNEVRVTIRQAEDVENALTKLRALAQPLTSSLMLGTSDQDIVVEQLSGADARIITVQPTQAALNERVSNAVASSIETIRRRIDELGTTEPIIQRQGIDRILLQVPGFNDPKRLKELVGQTAKLAFHLVDQTMTASEAQAGNPPPGSAIFVSRSSDEPDYLLEKRTIVSGEDLVDSQPGFDQQTQEPIVSFRFNTSGGQRFGKVTADNVGRPFAIVLDNKVISAPVIREPILGGSGQISGNFTVQEANDLAILLRSGALPASLTAIEERSVGPSLGADSIAAGEVATLIAFAAVTILMVLGYGLFGLFAVCALIVNVALIIAILSVLQATLTLPGIAGIALTMGVAVDANVLIYERIREELKAGKSNVIAIETGFSRAYTAIIDANLTGLLGGIILFWLGVGPIRGFAVTLCIGILASMFTAITLTRLLVTEWLRWKRPVTIPI